MEKKIPTSSEKSWGEMMKDFSEKKIQAQPGCNPIKQESH